MPRPGFEPKQWWETACSQWRCLRPHGRQSRPMHGPLVLVAPKISPIILTKSFFMQKLLYIPNFFPFKEIIKQYSIQLYAKVSIYSIPFFVQKMIKTISHTEKIQCDHFQQQRKFWKILAPIIQCMVLVSNIRCYESNTSHIFIISLHNISVIL